MRQISIVPPRSLAKKRYLPSGDHAGFQSVAASSVTLTGSAPAAVIVHRSRCPPWLANPQKAMRCPLGDHLGWTASLEAQTILLSPVATFTANNVPRIGLNAGSAMTCAVEYRISAPSGDHVGLNPALVKRFRFRPSGFMR